MSSPPKFTVVGAGAIGGTVGAYLAHAGTDVQFVDVAAAHVKQIREDGLTIEGPDGTLTVRVRAFPPDEVPRPLGTVLLAVKSHHTENAIGDIAPLLGRDEAVVSLQNGLCERVISRLVGQVRTIGAFVNFSADYLEPGRVRYSGPGDFYIGEVNGHDSQRVRDLARALQPWGPVRVTANIWGWLWSKLAYANMVFASALVDADQAGVVDTFRDLMVDLAREICQVAEQENIELVSFHGFEPGLYYPRTERHADAIRASMDHLVTYMRDHQKPRSGVWRDLAIHHRKTEVDQQLGVVIDIGARYGLQLPLTSQLVTMIHEVEDGSRKMTWSNLAVLDAQRTRLRNGAYSD